MTNLYEEADWLARDAQKISNELRTGQKPLPAIAYSIGKLMYRLAALRIDIVNEGEND